MPNTPKTRINIYFSDFFNIAPKVIEDFGALNISLVSDLPLFIDPFLLFHSTKEPYKEIHIQIIKYLHFLRKTSTSVSIGDKGRLKTLYSFSEVKQTWLGFTENSNKGKGLGPIFASKLDNNLRKIFKQFGEEEVTQSSHLEKLCLLEKGVGADSISDYTTNLIWGFLAEYTEEFAKAHLSAAQCKLVTIPRAFFNEETEMWVSKNYTLPYINGDYVLLTPIDIVAREKNWINRDDLIKDFEAIPEIITNEELRSGISNYFCKKLAEKSPNSSPTAEDKVYAINSTFHQFPELIDYYILLKEITGDKASKINKEEISHMREAVIKRANALVDLLSHCTKFYDIEGNTYEEALKRIQYLKHVIEDEDGYRIFHQNGTVKKRESDIHALFKLTWCGTKYDVNSEVNNGRGPVDFKVSLGSTDKTLVEFKLASNPQLERNLRNQVEIYKKANKTKKALKVILYFTKGELIKVEGILKKLGRENDPTIILIDARNDNKPSASKATTH
ncbi:MAG: hypothetical protein ACK4NC_03115 [Candidatus Gracilibacteria bacterium]